MALHWIPQPDESLFKTCYIDCEVEERGSNSVNQGTPRPPATITALEAADMHIVVLERHAKAVGLKGLRIHDATAAAWKTARKFRRQGLILPSRQRDLSPWRDQTGFGF